MRLVVLKLRTCTVLRGWPWLWGICSLVLLVTSGLLWLVVVGSTNSQLKNLAGLSGVGERTGAQLKTCACLWAQLWQLLPATAATPSFSHLWWSCSCGQLQGSVPLIDVSGHVWRLPS
jgi:uncharacterized membrane protein